MSKKKIYPGHYVLSYGTKHRVFTKDGEKLFIEHPNSFGIAGVFQDEAFLATDEEGKVYVQAGSKAWWEELIIWLGENLPTLIELITSLLLIFAKKQGEPNWYARMIIGKKNIQKFEETIHLV